MSRVLMLGLDGATFDLIGPWAREGKLPALARLMAEGTHRELASVVPPMSFPAWSTVLTGRNPGKHGIYDFTQRRPDSYGAQFINARWRKADTVARTLSAAGRRVALLSVPLTWPAEPVNGVMISGFDAPGIGGLADKSAIYPPDLEQRFGEVVRSYPISATLEALSGEALVAALVDTMKRRAAAALAIYRSEPWDFFMLVLGETDAVAHTFWSAFDPRSPLRDAASGSPALQAAIETVYRTADAIIGDFLAALHADTTVLVMSDHGHGGNGDKGIHLSRWLEKQGWLGFRSDTGGAGLLRSAGRRFVNTSKTLGVRLTPLALRKLVIRKTGIAGRMESWLRFSHVDWARTRVFSEESSYPSLSVNLRGREPMGIVEPGAEYEALLRDVISRMLEWKDPWTGRRICKAIHRREEIYHGPYTDQAPDLTIEWELDEGWSYVNRRSAEPGEPMARIAPEERRRVKSGHHRQDGILLAWGRHVRPGAAIDRPGLADLAPTVLALIGEAVPPDMDGRVLAEMLEAEVAPARPGIPAQAGAEWKEPAPGEADYSGEEEEVIRARLKALGYIE